MNGATQMVPSMCPLGHSVFLYPQIGSKVVCENIVSVPGTVWKLAGMIILSPLACLS